jgi:hypothetical protein
MKSRDQINITTTGWHDTYGKGLENLLESLSDTEKRTLRAIMSFEEENHRLAREKELTLLLKFQDMHLFEVSLKELKRKRLLKFMGRRRGRCRFSLTKRGRTLGVLACMHAFEST